MVRQLFKRLMGASVLGASLYVAALSLSPAQAAHGNYNPMMPRQLSEQAASANYTYGYSILAGHAIDTLDVPNRYMWYLNYNILDRYLLRPVAHGYAKLPRGFQDSMGHFFNNLGEVNNIPNNLLVGNFAQSGISLARLVLNSTVGFLGFFDVASQMGLTYSPMSMGTVLGKAQVEQGPFFMVPAYGPTTARDLHGDMIDGIPFSGLATPILVGKFVLEGIHDRAQLIDQEAVVDNAVDPYIQTRDVYLMYGENKVNPIAEGEVKSNDDFDESLLDEIDG